MEVRNCKVKDVIFCSLPIHIWKADILPSLSEDMVRLKYNRIILYVLGAWILPAMQSYKLDSNQHSRQTLKTNIHTFIDRDIVNWEHTIRQASMFSADVHMNMRTRTRVHTEHVLALRHTNWKKKGTYYCPFSIPQHITHAYLNTRTIFNLASACVWHLLCI